MDTAGRLPGGLVSEVMNIHSRKLYVISTSPEIGQDYWTTGILPIVQRKALFGLIATNVPDANHPIVSLIRNNKEDAHEVHTQVRHIVISEKEGDWFSLFPSPKPPEGYSEGAKKRLKEFLGTEKLPGVD